jgi:hypothetical protein
LKREADSERTQLDRKIENEKRVQVGKKPLQNCTICGKTLKASKTQSSIFQRTTTHKSCVGKLKRKTIVEKITPLLPKEPNLKNDSTLFLDEWQFDFLNSIVQDSSQPLSEAQEICFRKIVRNNKNLLKKLKILNLFI